MTDLRARLVDMRAVMVEKLEQRFDGGMLALLGTVGAALDAVERAPIEGERATRAVVSDGESIALSLYVEDGRVAVAQLSPLRAISLAGRLIEAALTRL